jgi:branched-chain amino acid transport system ATP-binding protein
VSLLEVEEVTVTFGGRRALDRVDLEVDPGLVTGLIGPNGAGKTTLFNVVCGLLAPDDGEVRIDGVDVTGLAPFKRARRGLGRTFQRLELFGLLDVHANVALAADVAGRPHPAQVADDLLAMVGLSDLAEMRADRLPTGLARRVELARALATGPRVLLLDEPASGQDEGETAGFAQLLRAVAADGVAVVLVEHDVSLVMDVCERIHVLDLGRVIARGTPTQVRADPAVIGAYLGNGGTVA